jgi:hypothetical protein
MSTFPAAIDKFLSVVVQHKTLQEMQDATAALHRHLPVAAADELKEALSRFLPALRFAHPVPASCVAISCGAIVEFGGDPAICGPAILQRLPRLLRDAAGFIQQVHQRAGVQEWEEPDLDQLINLHINDIIETNPDLAWAHLSQNSLVMGAIAHLSKSKPLRALARTRAELTETSRALDQETGNMSFLSVMLRVLDDERLIVLHPAERKGFAVRISGIADNFQLHTLLADAVIGDPNAGLLGGEKPAPEVVAAARDGAISSGTVTAKGAFNLWGWPALRADSTLPTAQADTTGWIWNEGNPADIPPFNGTRVLLLGPPAYERTWNAGRRFGRMAGELAIEEVLGADAVRDWLARLAVAPKPEQRRE